MPNFDDASFSFFHLQPDLDSTESGFSLLISASWVLTDFFFLGIFYIFLLGVLINGGNWWWNSSFMFLIFFCFNHFFCSAFEKSLRARLVKVIIPIVKIHFWTQQYCPLNKFFFFFFPNQTNPDTDYHCLKSFGSCFRQDIQIPAVICYWSLYLFGNWYDGVNLKFTETFH